MVNVPPLVSLDDGFSAWPLVELRSAGFSVALLAPLIDSTTAALAARSLLHQASVSDARRTVIHALLERRRHAKDEDTRAQLGKAKRAVESGREPEFIDEALRAPLAALREARRARSIVDEELRAAHAAGMERASRHVVDVCAHERFQRAILWQNKGAQQGTFAALKRHALANAIRPRELALALSYLTRYATKNDTVGFMGPVGWASIVDDDVTLTSTPGSKLLRRFDVHFEPWAIAALADALVARVERHVAPTMNPRVVVDDDMLLGIPSRRLDGGTPISVRERAVLARIDGDAVMSTFLDDDDDVAVIRDFVTRRIARIRLPVTTSVTPERTLRDALTAMPDDDDNVVAARTSLQRVTDAKDAVVAAQNHVGDLARALTILDDTFVSETGGPAERNAGRTYGSRTLLYANGCRDVEVRMGRPFVAQMARPLALLSRLARAFSVDVAKRFLKILADIHTSIAARRRQPRSPAPLVYDRLVTLFREPPPPFLRDARANIARRAAELFGSFDVDAREVRLSTQALAPRVRALFPETAPGYPGARHHSPDVLVHWNDDETFTCVLGEIHAGTNTLTVQQALDQSDDRELLRALFRRDLPAPLFIEMQHEDFGLCAHDSLLDDTDIHVDTGSRFSSWLGPHRTVPLAALSLEIVDGHLRVFDDEGFPFCDALQLFERLLRLNATTEFHLPITTPHQPRVILDDMVIQRESWTFTRAQIEPLVSSKDVARIMETARFRQQHALPRHLFVRVPHEKKPIYLDLESPLVVDMVCRALASAQTTTFSEMLPAPDHTWLRDRESAPYVSEFRFVVVDDAPWVPIPIPSEVTT